MSGQSAPELRSEGTGVGAIVEPDIVDVDSRLTKFLGEVPHGAQKQNDFLLMMRNVAALVFNLEHQYNVVRPIDTGESRYTSRQLIAKH